MRKIIIFCSMLLFTVTLFAQNNCLEFDASSDYAGRTKPVNIVTENDKVKAKKNLAIYNLKGQLVKKLYSGVTSKHTVMWDGKDEDGKALENGVYLYRLLLNGKSEEMRKLILMK